MTAPIYKVGHTEYSIGNANDFIPARIDQMVTCLEDAVDRDNTPLLIETVAELLPRYRPWSNPEADGARDATTVGSQPESGPNSV